MTVPADPIVASIRGRSDVCGCGPVGACAKQVQPWPASRARVCSLGSQADTRHIEHLPVHAHDLGKAARDEEPQGLLIVALGRACTITVWVAAASGRDEIAAHRRCRISSRHSSDARAAASYWLSEE
jgi:hypothetical protein